MALKNTIEGQNTRVSMNSAHALKCSELIAILSETVAHARKNPAAQDTTEKHFS